MAWFVTCYILVVTIYGGGGVTKRSGIEQFWTDDYKIFEHVYGKTSDKDIYGEILPSFVINTDKNKEASEKNERYLFNGDTDELEDFQNYNFADRYNNILSKPLKPYSEKPETSSINFISSTDFKPITKTNDPDTYNYLKHLEEYNKGGAYEYPLSFGGFKPYTGVKPEDTDAYKSIQDILDAHESNKEDESVKYINYPKNKKKKPPRNYNGVNKHRCNAGRCRKRGTYYRSRGRPYVRGLKIISVV